MEHKSVSLELKDMSRDKRTAVIAHAVYGNIDLVGDISTKGMFSSSWERKGKVDFLYNHREDEIPGSVLRTFEDDHKAYTEVKFGNWKLGDDLLEMLEAEVIRGASFGYSTEKKEYKNINGKTIRVLRQVHHTETSLLTKTPANPLAGVVTYKKEAAQDVAAHLHRMQEFCRNSNASDETIQYFLGEIKSLETALSQYDTASTPLITDGDASRNDNEFATQLHLLKLTL